MFSHAINPIKKKLYNICAGLQSQSNGDVPELVPASVTSGKKTKNKQKNTETKTLDKATASIIPVVLLCFMFGRFCPLVYLQDINGNMAYKQWNYLLTSRKFPTMLMLIRYTVRFLLAMKYSVKSTAS